MISEEYKSVFIHIPKTGGTTIGNILHKDTIITHKKTELGNKYSDIMLGDKYHIAEHLHYYHYEKILSDENKNIKNYYVFAFVRNPFSRVCSFWQMIFNHYNIIKTPHFIDLVEKQYKWLKNSLYDLNKQNFNRFIMSRKLTALVAPMSNFIAPSQANFIGRFENFQDDLTIVLEKLNIPLEKYKDLHLNSKPKKIDYASYYDNQSVAKIVQIFEKDFDMFNYNKKL